jgi:hypothetical protein
MKYSASATSLSLILMNICKKIALTRALKQSVFVGFRREIMRQMNIAHHINFSMTDL